MTNCTPHSMYSIAPAADLARQTYAAFKAAIYHLVVMEKLYANGQTKSADLDVDALHRELRSFFWELSSSYEIMLHWATKTFDLDICERKVTQSSVLTAPPTKALSPKERTRLTTVRSELKNAYNSAWHCELRLYRNFSIHRGYLGTTKIVVMPEHLAYKKDDPIDEGLVAYLQIYPVREGQESGGDMFLYLHTYIQEMRKLGESIFTDAV